MFGQHQSVDDDNHPEQSIDGVIASDTMAPPPPVAPPHDWQHPGQPLGQSQVTPADPEPVQPTTDSNDDAEPVADSNLVSPSTTNDRSDDISNSELADIKRQVLTQLSPLVGHLDQLPEERFRTLMMMIQASDDQALLKQAYEAAQKIHDEKARAQALLDIVNEINYFTQHQEN